MFEIPNIRIMHDDDPKILYTDALDVFDGNQSALAEALSIARATVHNFKDRQYIPPLHAYRLLKRYPRKFKRLDKNR